MTGNRQLRRATAELKLIAARRDESMAADLEATLAAIASIGDRTVIAPLLECLEDDSPREEVLFSIVHYVESFGPAAYVEELVHATADLRDRAPEWARTLFMRALNSDAARAALVRTMRAQAIEVCVVVRDVLGDIRSRNPTFATRVEEVLG